MQQLDGDGMRVLGVDPGTRRTGYGLVEDADGGFQLRECGVIRAGANDPLSGCLLKIHRGLLDVIDRTKPACVVVEGVFYGRNVRSAIVLAHARGVIVFTAALRELPVIEYPPAQIKKAVVGAGGATKEQVGFMVQKHLRLASAPEPADAADGCAAALCHLLGGGARSTSPGSTSPVSSTSPASAGR